MQAIREIRDIVSQELTVKVPKEFLKRRVEIIVLLVDEKQTEMIPEPDNGSLEREIEALSWNMGERLYTTRDQLYE